MLHSTFPPETVGFCLLSSESSKGAQISGETKVFTPQILRLQDLPCQSPPSALACRCEMH